MINVKQYEQNIPSLYPSLLPFTSSDVDEASIVFVVDVVVCWLVDGDGVSPLLLAAQVMIAVPSLWVWFPHSLNINVCPTFVIVLKSGVPGSANEPAYVKVPS